MNDFRSRNRTGHSTQTALLKLTDDVTQLTALLRFDFRKAFGLVTHSTLFAKFRYLSFQVRFLDKLHHIKPQDWSLFRRSVELVIFTICSSFLEMFQYCKGF